MEWLSSKRFFARFASSRPPDDAAENPKPAAKQKRVVHPRFDYGMDNVEDGQNNAQPGHKV